MDVKISVPAQHQQQAHYNESQIYLPLPEQPQIALRKPSIKPDLTDDKIIPPSSTLSPGFPSFNESSNKKHESNSVISQQVVGACQGDKVPIKSWIVAFGGFCGFTVLYGVMDSMGAIESYIAEHELKNTSPSVVGWIFSIFMIIGLGLMFITGTIYDRFGAKFPLYIGSMMMFVGLFTMASCTQIYQFILAFSVLCGLSLAVMTSPLTGIIPLYFPPNKTALASALLSTGGSIGGSVYPVVLRKLYTRFGFLWAMRIFAFMNFFLLVLCCILVTVNNDKKPHMIKIEAEESKNSFVTTTTEEQLKFSDNDFETHFQNKSIFKKIIHIMHDSLDLSALKDPQFLCISLGVLFAEGTIIVIFTYIASYAISVGVSENTAYLLLTIMNVIGIPSRWITGIVADRYGKFNTMIIMSLFSTIILFIILLPFGQKSKPALYLFIVLIGIFSCSVFTLTPACLAQVTKVNVFGRRYGTMYLVAAIGNFFIPISGAIIGKGTATNYNNYAIFTGVTAFCGTLCWYFARWLAVKNEWVVY